VRGAPMARWAMSGARLLGTASLAPTGPPSLHDGVLRQPPAVWSATRPSLRYSCPILLVARRAPALETAGPMT